MFRNSFFGPEDLLAQFKAEKARINEIAARGTFNRTTFIVAIEKALVATEANQPTSFEAYALDRINLIKNLNEVFDKFGVNPDDHILDVKNSTSSSQDQENLEDKLSKLVRKAGLNNEIVVAKSGCSIWQLHTANKPNKPSNSDVKVESQWKIRRI